jgi:pimeloyl-ACP methyl ester carboxylesterase
LRSWPGCSPCRCRRLHPIPTATSTSTPPSLKVPARVRKAALAGLIATDNRAELARIQAPTLIVWGDQDTVFPLSDQQALKAGIPDSRLLIYPQTGHGVHWEQPQRFTADLTAFP